MVPSLCVGRFHRFASDGSIALRVLVPSVCLVFSHRIYSSLNAAVTLEHYSVGIGIKTNNSYFFKLGVIFIAGLLTVLKAICSSLFTLRQFLETGIRRALKNIKKSSRNFCDVVMYPNLFLFS
jgi:hypothetical protein